MTVASVARVVTEPLGGSALARAVLQRALPPGLQPWSPATREEWGAHLTRVRRRASADWFARVEAAMHGSNNRHVRLPNEIPVYITYMTTFVREGNLWFGNDLYSRDQKLAEAVWGGAMPSGEAVRAVAALRKLTD